MSEHVRELHMKCSERIICLKFSVLRVGAVCVLYAFYGIGCALLQR